jgi:hypothetical protein
MGDEVSDWLETVGTGYGGKYVMHFHAYGADTMEELYGLDHDDRERLFEILVKTRMKELHLRKIKKALTRLCQDGSSTGGNTSDGGSVGTSPPLAHDAGDNQVDWSKKQYDNMFTNFLNDIEPGELLDDSTLPHSPLLRSRNFSFSCETMETPTGGELGKEDVVHEVLVTDTPKSLDEKNSAEIEAAESSSKSNESAVKISPLSASSATKVLPTPTHIHNTHTTHTHTHTHVFFSGSRIMISLTKRPPKITTRFPSTSTMNLSS